MSKKTKTMSVNYTAEDIAGTLRNYLDQIVPVEKPKPVATPKLQLITISALTASVASINETILMLADRMNDIHSNHDFDAVQSHLSDMQNFHALMTEYLAVRKRLSVF
ncbi:hypothetical protein Q4Q49_02515 [Shewanella sp. SP1S1-7]|uniref:hypothetical protein n=1 Tax=Shewanella sp. SP1S1-7 TaxID=3063536 RepID=UPI00288D84E9|nr:hypothetical protein [Shewanella sp. SP1S1-7]MDT3334157.1 hypothetical protein [Shewanella sp. SP1S1-7]